MKPKTTLVNSVVAISTIVLFVAIVLPVLHKPRDGVGYGRMKCGTQLRGILQAMALYQNEYNELNPLVGDPRGEFARFGADYYGRPDPKSPRGYSPHSRFTDTSIKLDWSREGEDFQYASTAVGSLYLLVRTQDLWPDMLLCPSDVRVRAERMDLGTIKEYFPVEDQTHIQNWSDLPDFVNMRNLSYAYNDPFRSLLDSMANSSTPVVADCSNKYLSKDGRQIPRIPTAHPDYNGTWPDVTWDDDGGRNDNPGNSPNHQFDMQNVGFADGHVDQFQTPLAGLAGDNIYTHWISESPTAEDRTTGLWDGGNAMNKKDAYLGL